DFHLDAGMNIDALFQAGYDTRGLREMLADPNNNPALLLDGFYIGKDSHFIFGGGVQAVAEFDSAFFDFGLSGGISGNVNISADPNADADLDGKIRFTSNEMGQYMFTASGSIDLTLSAFVRVGVEIAGEFIGFEDDFEIGSVNIVD